MRPGNPFRTQKINVCLPLCWHAFSWCWRVFSKARKISANARKYLTKARKFFTSAEKVLAKHTLFWLKPYVLELGSDLNSRLRVEPWTMHGCAAFGPDLHGRDRVRLLEMLISFRFKLSSIQGILPCIFEDHVKHHRELFCLEAITSNIAWNIAWNFPAPDTIRSGFHRHFFTETRSVVSGEEWNFPWVQLTNFKSPW